MALGMQASPELYALPYTQHFPQGHHNICRIKLSHIVYPHLMQLTLALDKTIKLAPIKRGLMNGTEGLTASSLL